MSTIWVCKITVLCLPPEPSYQWGNSFCLLLSHAPEYLEYMSLIRFIKLGDKIYVQNTYRRFLEINSRVSSSNSSLEPGSLGSFSNEDGNTEDDALQK